MKVDLLTLGETMAALRSGGPLKLGGQLQLSVAGAESNVAIGVARLGHRTRWVGRVGDDELGTLVAPPGAGSKSSIPVSSPGATTAVATSTPSARSVRRTNAPSSSSPTRPTQRVR